MRRLFRQPSETFGPYDPGAPTQQPDVSTPARAMAVRIEDAIRRDSAETGVFIGVDGTVLLRRQGQADRVTYLETELLRMRGTTFTHNHPGDVSFSMADYDAAVFGGIRELRAVSPSFRHMLLLSHSMPAAQELQRLATLRAAAISERVRTLVNHDAVRAPFTGVELQHQFWVEASRVFGFSYTRDRS
jgi:hypothetical protein